MLSQQRKE
jgi:hypothetical protein